jgi:hypothetical protein
MMIAVLQFDKTRSHVSVDIIGIIHSTCIPGQPGGMINPRCACAERVTVVVPGADPEILHGRWLMGWLPIVNYTGARGVAG